MWGGLFFVFIELDPCSVFPCSPIHRTAAVVVYDAVLVDDEFTFVSNFYHMCCDTLELIQVL